MEFRRVLFRSARYEPDRVREVVASLRGGVAGTMRRLVAAWDYVASEKPKNLVINGDFEAVGENEAKAEKDWVTQGAPPGWSAWHRRPRATRFDTVETTGPDDARRRSKKANHAGRITESDSACFLQSIKVMEGESYLCQLKAKRLPDDGNANISLTIRWRTPTGEWHSDGSTDKSVALPPKARGWQPLFLCVDVPKGAGYLVFMCSVIGQAEGAAALFDDTAVYRIAPASK